MPLPASAATWKYARFIVRALENAIPAGVAYLASALSDGNEEAALTWMRWHCIATRTTPAGTVEDKAQFKLDLLNITAGAVDSTWTAADFTACRTPIEVFLNVLAPRTGNTTYYSQHAAYMMRFDPNDPGPGAGPGSTSRPFQDTGPPVYLQTISIPGTASPVMPYQVSGTVTFRTPWAKHWGRAYLPSCPQSWTAQGRIGSGDMTAIANGAKAMASSLADAGFLHVIPVGQLNKQAFHALLGVTQYVVDDVPDVQRRRRPKQAAVRTVGV
jgi:hypothetical protein